MREDERRLKKLCDRLNGVRTLDEKILDQVPLEVIDQCGDFIIQELSWAMEEKEPFAEEKAAEKKAAAEKKKTTKEFGEW